MSTDSPPPWLEAGPFQLAPGHAFGRRQPTLAASLRQDELHGPMEAARWRVAPEALSQALRTAVHGRVFIPCVPSDGSSSAWTEYAAYAAVALLLSAGLPVVDSPQMLASDQAAQAPDGLRRVMLPMVPGLPVATRRAWQVALEVINRWSAAQEAPSLAAYLRDGLESIRKMALRGSNTPRFVAAAFELGIPVISLGAGVFQFGQGRKAEWMDSTFTLKTSNISSRLARDKHAAAARLRQAGLPVPAHQLVADVDEAVRVASVLGYPVVVKPADQDGGKGVAAGLDGEAEVRAAYDRAKEVSGRILVEKHFHGRDHRLTVLDGQLLWAIERIAAGVVGDGVHSVTQLVEQENDNPLRSSPNPPLKKIVLDDDALQVLGKAYLTPDAIPTSGQFVALRRIANVEAGGRPVAVNDRVHPDNAQLAVRAAQALRLDLAGIDLLIPDITRSWREVGAAICEVNAQPQLGATTGPHLYGQILRQRLGGDGRIPIVLVLGDAADGPVVQAIERRLQAKGYGVGRADAQGAFVDGEWIFRGPDRLFEAGVALLTHPRVEALVLSLQDMRVLRTGLPADRIDWLVLASHAGDLAHRLLPSILPSCVGRLVDLAGDGDLLRQYGGGGNGRVVDSMNLAELLAAMDLQDRRVQS